MMEGTFCSVRMTTSARRPANLPAKAQPFYPNILLITVITVVSVRFPLSDIHEQGSQAYAKALQSAAS